MQIPVQFKSNTAVTYHASLTASELGSTVSHKAGISHCVNAKVFKSFQNVHSWFLHVSPIGLVASHFRTYSDVGTILLVEPLHQNPSSWKIIKKIHFYSRNIFIKECINYKNSHSNSYHQYLSYHISYFIIMHWL